MQIHITQPKLHDNSRISSLLYRDMFVLHQSNSTVSLCCVSREKHLRRKSVVVTRIFFCFLAWVASIIHGLFLILGPVMGAFLNKFGFRVTTIVGCLLCSLGVTLGSFVSTIYMLYVTFSIPFAMGQSLVFVSEAIIVNNYFDKRKSFALGLVTSGQGLGTMILSPSLQAAVDVLEWRNTFRVFGGLLAVSSLTGVILHQSPSSQEGNMNCSSKKWSWNLSLFKNSTILVLITTGAALMFSRLVPYVHLVSI